MGNGIVVKQSAGDIKIYREVLSSEDHSILQFEIQKLRDWSVAQNFPLAPEKTVFMRIGSSAAPSQYIVGDYPISRLRALRDLGFHYENKLDLSGHYKVIQRKAQSHVHSKISKVSALSTAQSWYLPTKHTQDLLLIVDRPCSLLIERTLYF